MNERVKEANKISSSLIRRLFDSSQLFKASVYSYKILIVISQENLKKAFQVFFELKTTFSLKSETLIDHERFSRTWNLWCVVDALHNSRILYNVTWTTRYNRFSMTLCRPRVDFVVFFFIFEGYITTAICQSPFSSFLSSDRWEFI